MRTIFMYINIIYLFTVDISTNMVSLINNQTLFPSLFHFIGKNCSIFQNATLGGTGKDTGKRHPTLGDNVMVSAGAKVLGPFKVGDNSKIGAGAVVLSEVPPNSTVVGVPGRVVRRDNVRVDCASMDQRLPDPIKEEFQRLCSRIGELERRVARDEAETAASKAEE